MKILQVTAGLQETCGVSNFVVESSRMLQQLGHEVCIVTTMTCGYPMDDLNVQLLEDPTQVAFKPDIVHLHNCWNLYVHRMAVWCRKQKIPYVISPHGSLTPWALRYKWWKKWPALLLYQYLDLFHASFLHVTVCEEGNDVKRILKLGNDIVVAPLGIHVKPIKMSARDKIILFLGRIHPKKGIDMLLQAWNKISTIDRSGWKLVIAGPDDIGHQQELKDLAEKLHLTVRDFSHELAFGKKQIEGGGEVPAEVYREKLSEASEEIIFTGPVYGEAKEYLYQHSRYFILPSHSENFGVVVLEALAAGTPVIATEGTPWEELKQEKCGWWIPADVPSLHEVIKEVISLPQEAYQAYSRNAYHWALNKYSWKIIGKRLSDGYRTVLSR